MTSWAEYFQLWFRPENFWIILGSLLVYYLRMMKPIMEKTNAILEVFMTEKALRDEERKRHHDVTIEIRDELKSLNKKLNS